MPELTRLQEWLDRGYAGEMVYLHKSADTRADIRNFLPSARSVIVTATNYFVDAGGGPTEGGPRTHHIARYAWGEDYHVVLAERLEQLLAWMRERTDMPFEARDLRGQASRPGARLRTARGLGWIGKNTC